MKTVCILYGLAEGAQIGKRLQTELQAKGYDVTQDAAKADVIITHSGGCLLLPKVIKAKHILQIGTYFWPGKPWVVAMSGKVVRDLRIHHTEGELRFWAQKTFWNLVYSWKIAVHCRMLFGLLSGAQWRHGSATIVVRPRFDTFCTPNPKLFQFRQAPAFVSMPGGHDECWRNPAPYIELLCRLEHH